MVPTLIFFGLIFGRWWRAALVTVAVAWPALLVLSGTMTLESGLVGASLIGVANAAAGVAIHRGVLAVVRNMRGSERVGESD